jgi:hypothetical protein
LKGEDLSRGVRPQQKREPRFKTCSTPKKGWYMTVKAQHLTIFCIIFDDWYIKLLTYSDSFSFRMSGCAGCATFFQQGTGADGLQPQG